MNKSAFFKKLILPALAILYDIISLFLCYIISSCMIFYFSFLFADENSVAIIGEADIMFQINNIFGCVLPVLFVLLDLGTAFLFTVSAFKNQPSRKLTILLIVFATLSLIVFIRIPTQAYVVSLYALIRKFSLFKYSQIFYILISVATIIYGCNIVCQGRNSGHTAL